MSEVWHYRNIAWHGGYSSTELPQLLPAVARIHRTPVPVSVDLSRQLGNAFQRALAILNTSDHVATANGISEFANGNNCICLSLTFVCRTQAVSARLLVAPVNRLRHNLIIWTKINSVTCDRIEYVISFGILR